MAVNQIPQLQVLNYILNTKDSSLISLNNLTDEYFRDFKKEFNFIKNHIDTYGRVPDVETFFSTFKNCKRIVVNESPSFLIKNLYDDYNTKKIVEVVNAIKPALLEGKVDDAVAQIKDTMENMSQGISLPTKPMRSFSRIKKEMSVKRSSPVKCMLRFWMEIIVAVLRRQR